MKDEGTRSGEGGTGSISACPDPSYVAQDKAEPGPQEDDVPEEQEPTRPCPEGATDEQGAAQRVQWVEVPDRGDGQGLGSAHSHENKNI